MEAEGVIKFELHFQAADPVAMEQLQELNAWRSRLWQLRLIGQDPARYGGFGYGNVSMRIGTTAAARGERAFLISGTQTGALPELDNRHYCLVERYDIPANRIEAAGPVRPSSESLTHGMIYDLDTGILAVMHVHSAEIWQAAAWLGLPLTDPGVDYGTPAMAAEVERLFRETNVRQQHIFAMSGHQDGIVAFGSSVAQAGEALLTASRQAGSQQQQQ